MKILVDENIPLMTVIELRKQGFDVIDIRGTEDQGLPDRLLWEKAQKAECLVITTDKGFTTYRDQPHSGILVIRLKQPTRHKIHDRDMQAFRKYPAVEWSGRLVVMRDTVQSTWKSQH